MWQKSHPTSLLTRSCWTSRSLACARPRRVMVQCAGSNQDLAVFLCEAGTSSCGAPLLSVTESGAAQTTTATETKHRTKCRCSDGKYCTTECTKAAQREVLRRTSRARSGFTMRRSPRAKEDTEVSKTTAIRCTHGETNSCTR
jgi:hypothetical protein